jgi:DNA-binding transcriptional MerR regulator
MDESDALLPGDGPTSTDGPVSAEGPVATDGKAPDAFRTIGEVAKMLDIRQHVLRYWEDQFPMLRPVKRSGGRRYYRPEDVRLVQRIDRLVHAEGYTLRGARQALEAEGKAGRSAARTVQAPVQTPAASSSATGPGISGQNIYGELRAIRARLAAALAE